MSYQTILYTVDAQVATVTLNRPEQVNTIVPPMPEEIRAAVGEATRDPKVKVILLRGAGRAFCCGYDFGDSFEHWGEQIASEGLWDAGKDFVFSTSHETAPTQQLLSIWRCPKPVIAQIHGWCVGGGSDFALAADIVIASEDAVIGTPYSRMWGTYQTGMWALRLSMSKAKYHGLTGRPFSGRQAADCELINEAVPFAELETRVREVAQDLCAIPLSQLAAMKLVLNQAYESQGLHATQALGPIVDGLMRNTPDALRFVERVGAEGVRALVAERDRHFGDYSQAPPEQRPNPEHVIVP